MTETNAADSINRGMLLIISGPSGVGKTTITHEVEQRLDGVFSVSMTTRPQAATDVEGKDYFFVSRDAFETAVADGELLEWAEVFGNLYGTPRQPVEEQLQQGRLMILEIDVEGAVQVKKNMPDSYAIFVLPPSEQTLLQRLRDRKREDEQTIQKRFAKAKNEIQRARECNCYDAFLVNDALDQTIEQAIRMVDVEQKRRAATRG